MKKLFLVICLSFFINIFIVFANTKSSNTNIETIGLIERMNVNKIDLPIVNDGSTGDNATAYYPNGQTNLSFLFQGGFATTAYVNGELRASWMAKGYLINDWQPGIWGMDPTDQLAKFYIVNSSDGFGSAAFIDWQNAVSMGADFQDLDGNGIYDPYIDRPAISGDRTIWFPLNDNTPMAQRTTRLNTKPIGLEAHITVWAWDKEDEFEDIIFFRYRIINATDTVKNNLIFSVWADSDIGDADDDLAACDTTLHLGYFYNHNDDYQYGINPPAFGVQVLQGAFVPSNGDTAYKIVGNFLGIDTLFNTKNLLMSSFMLPMKAHPVLPDPFTAEMARYYQIGGLDAQGNPLDPSAWGTGGSIATNPKYIFSGDPVTGSGWIDNSPEDRRSLVNCGPFNMAVSDTQDIIIAYVVSQGINALNSITELKQRAEIFNDFLPRGRILSIHTNKKIASLDSSFEFGASLTSFSLVDTIKSVDWFLIDKPVTSMAMIVPDSNFTGSLIPDMVGVYEIKLQAIITGNDTLSRIISVSVVNNHPPSVQLTIDPDQIIFGEKLSIDASNSFDPDGDTLHFDWLLPEWLQFTPFDTSKLDIYPPHTGSDILNLTVIDNYFTVSENDSFYISPLQNGLNLRNKISEYNSIKHIQIDSTFLFILDNSQDLSVIDIQTDSVLVSTLVIGNNKFIIDGNYIISQNDFNEIIIGEFDPNFIYLEHSRIQVQILGRPFKTADFHSNYPYLYIPVYPNQLHVYNISNPQSPILINSFSLPPFIIDVAFDNDIAVIYSRYPGLGIISIDISDSSNVTFLDTLNISLVDRNIIYEGNRIYAINGLRDGNEILIIDSSDPINLSQTATINIGSIIQGSYINPILEMKTENEKLFIMTKDGVKIFDVSDPYNPKEIANFHTGLAVSDIAWDFPFLYTGIPGDLRFGAGLNVLEYDTSFIYGFDDNPKDKLPEDFHLSQNYPNPFNPSTTINYELPNSAMVKIQIFDILGQHVKTLVNKKQNQGKYDIGWNGLNKTGKNVSSGIYFYSLQTERFAKTKKMLLIR